MLNVVYYAVSAILWCWHMVFGSLFGDASALAWALAIVFLVFTLRAVLVKPAINQVRSAARLAEIGPQMAAIKKRYARDRQRQLREVQALQRDHGISPLGGCLSALLQIPVFIGLNHVLRSFTEHPHQPNYVFSLAGVRSYLDATLFHAHLGDAVVNIGFVTGSAGGGPTWMWGVAPVAVPLMVVAAFATHVTARMSASRARTAAVATGAPSRLVPVLTMWVFPLGVLVFGGALPVGLLIYWVSNNLWTLGQQRFVLAGEASRERGVEASIRQVPPRPAPPRPGQKPLRRKRGH